MSLHAAAQGRRWRSCLPRDDGARQSRAFALVLLRSDVPHSLANLYTTAQLVTFETTAALTESAASRYKAAAREAAQRVAEPRIKALAAEFV